MVDQTAARTGPREPGAHPLVVTHAATYLIYTFVAGEPIDIHKVAHKLMKAGVAETAYSSATREVRVAPRYGGLVGVRQRAAAIREYLAGTLTLRAGVRLMWKYPRGGRELSRLVFVFTKLRAQVWFHTHKPIGRNRTTDETPPSEKPTGDGEAGEDDDTDDLVTIGKQLIEQMQTVENDVVEAVATAQSTGAIQILVDEKLLKLGYLLTEPYLRLGLRGTEHRFIRDTGAVADDGLTAAETSGGTDEPAEERGAFADPDLEMSADGVAPPPSDDSAAEDAWVHVDALAMLHRAGVVQLMLRVPLPDTVTGSEVVGKVTSKEPVITASVVPEPLLEPSRKGSGSPGFTGHWQDDIAGGVRWRQVDFDEPISIDSVFDLYFTALTESMPSHVPNWRCYPVLIANGVGCGCDRVHGVEQHRNDLARLMLQLDNPGTFRDELINDQVHDVSSMQDASLHLTEARGARIYWGADREVSWPDDLFTLIPIEQALLQRGQLSSLEWQFTEAAAEPKNLEKLEESVITGLEEFRSSQMTASDAQALADRILDRMRVHELYSRLMDSVNQLHQKVTAAASQRSAARANLLAFLAVLVAVGLGLPAIQQSIEIANTVPDESALAPTAQPLVWLGDQGSTGLWGAFLVMVAVTLVVWAAGTTHRRGRRRRLRRRSAGRAWDVDLEVRFEADTHRPDPADKRTGT